MPTSKPRHTITETGPVKRVLDLLRDAGEPITSQDVATLIVLGGETRLHELAEIRADEQERRELRERFLELSCDEIDVPALHAAHDDGWSR